MHRAGSVAAIGRASIVDEAASIAAARIGLVIADAAVETDRAPAIVLPPCRAVAAGITRSATLIAAREFAPAPTADMPVWVAARGAVVVAQHQLPGEAAEAEVPREAAGAAEEDDADARFSMA
jgi:hypothetical protein